MALPIIFTPPLPELHYLQGRDNARGHLSSFSFSARFFASPRARLSIWNSRGPRLYSSGSSFFLHLLKSAPVRAVPRDTWIYLLSLAFVPRLCCPRWHGIVFRLYSAFFRGLCFAFFPYMYGECHKFAGYLYAHGYAALLLRQRYTVCKWGGGFMAETIRDVSCRCGLGWWIFLDWKENIVVDGFNDGLRSEEYSWRKVEIFFNDLMKEGSNDGQFEIWFGGTIYC